MVEIMTIGAYTNWIEKVGREKGGHPGQYRLMALLLWCLGEIAGAFAGLSLVRLDDPMALLVIYLCALAGAALGAGLAYLIARRSPVVE